MQTQADSIERSGEVGDVPIAGGRPDLARAAAQPPPGPASSVASPSDRGGPGRADRRTTLHFRRIYSPLSETFIREPLKAMAAMGVPVRVLALIRAVPRSKTLPVVGLVPFRGILRSAHGLRRQVVKQVGLSDPDTLIWPLCRPFLLWHGWRMKPTLIHAHFGPDGCLIRPIARLLRVPLVVNFYGYDVSRIFHTDPDRWIRRYRKLFRDASALVAISEHIASKLVDVGAPRDKIHVIPLGIHPEVFQGMAQRRAEARRSAPATNGVPTVRCLHIGRLTAKKDPVTTIRAFAIARQELTGRVDLRLDIVGDGPLRTECEEVNAASGHADAVSFHGSLSHERVFEMLERADIYTQHSVTAPDGDMEGLGVTFMEASAAGLPIVATLHDGIPEVVAQGQTGILVEEKDTQGMARAIVELALDPDRRSAMGAAGMTRVAERFTADRMIQRVLELHRVVGSGIQAAQN
ncbi:MAG: glycosyltransferase [Phycisphaerales bacterium]